MSAYYDLSGTRDSQVNLEGGNTQNIYISDREIEWPVQIGVVPPQATATQRRQALRNEIEENRDTILSQVLGGEGGVGKTQLAVAYATEADTDLVVWVDATQATSVISQFAAAAQRLRLPGAAGKNQDSDACTFLGWLASTPKSWLVVLDNVTDSAALQDWWPRSTTTGRVLATTRLQHSTLSGSGRQVIRVGLYTEQESLAYLSERLNKACHSELFTGAAAELAEALGRLPLALSHAAAYMIDQQRNCTEYLALFRDQLSRLDELMPGSADGDSRNIRTTLLLALEAADSAEPRGLARPAMHLVACLRPEGHPEILWQTSAIASFLEKYRSGDSQENSPLSPGDIRQAILLLHRFGLLNYDHQKASVAIRIHALTARATREGLTEVELTEAIQTNADALSTIWPQFDFQDLGLATTLRANMEALCANDTDALWDDAMHDVLIRAGLGLHQLNAHSASIAYWKKLLVIADKKLGLRHSDTILILGNLASAYTEAGHINNAIYLQNLVFQHCVRILGPKHPETLGSLNNLAASYLWAGNSNEAISLLSQVLDDRTQILGAMHSDTITSRHNLAAAYSLADRTDEAITLREQVLEDRIRLSGSDHVETLIAKSNLSTSYHYADRTTEAITLRTEVLQDCTRILGAEHPDTLIAMGNLATSYLQADRTKEATELLKHGERDSTRLLGTRHPNTLTMRHNLATAHYKAGRVREAIEQLKQVEFDRTETLGVTHPHTVLTRNVLAEWQM
ncbi:tetratricopeptide repeat protein [Pseudonocardiaceae bacterium YIM PH 21723]|nr:tetratricopeptide repeat protein [Pseudonocardiaceae bacterium YIM PH 21723]